MDGIINKTECLSGTVLKLIAVVSMTIDHIGYIFFPNQIWLRILGRLAFPIFAYMIAEGCFYTRNKKRYLFLVAAIGVLCQAAEVIFQNSWELNIMFTLALSILLIFLLQWAKGRKEILRWGVFIFALAACAFLDFGLTKLCPGFRIDYGFFGILMAVVIYIAPKKYQKLGLMMICLILMTIIRRTPLQWWALFAVIPLLFYNGKPGKYRMKYFFYLYYPVHLAILWGIYLYG